MKTLSPAEHAAALKDRRQVPVRTSYSQLDDGLHVRYTYVKPWPQMAAEQRVTVLALIAADLRMLAEQMDSARLEIAAEELAA